MPAPAAGEAAEGLRQAARAAAAGHQRPQARPQDAGGHGPRQVLRPRLRVLRGGVPGARLHDADAPTRQAPELQRGHRQPRHLHRLHGLREVVPGRLRRHPHGALRHRDARTARPTRRRPSAPTCPSRRSSLTARPTVRRPLLLPGLPAAAASLLRERPGAARGIRVVRDGPGAAARGAGGGGRRAHPVDGAHHGAGDRRPRRGSS